MRIGKYLTFYLLLSGCTIDRGIITPSGYVVSNSKDFKLKNKFTLIDTTILATDRVYVATCFTKLSVLKFYSNGRAAIISLDSTDRTRPNAGYYSITKDEIRIEMSQSQTLGLTGTECAILTMQGKISGDTLTFFKTQWYGKGQNLKEYTTPKGNGVKCYYLKSNIYFLSKTADW